MIGGMFSVKSISGRALRASAVAGIALAKIGTATEPIAYEKNAAATENTYTNKTEKPKSLDAFLPILAIAGATVPKIINGTANMMIWFVMCLTLMIIFITASLTTCPRIRPSINAAKRRNGSDLKNTFNSSSC